MTATTATRAKLAQTSTCRRDQRSSSTPANGPSSENGSSTTASAEAIAVADGRSWEKSAYDAIATWKTPSVSWLATRTVKRRRNHRPRSRRCRWASAVMGVSRVDHPAPAAPGDRPAPHPSRTGAGQRGAKSRAAGAADSAFLDDLGAAGELV